MEMNQKLAPLGDRAAWKALKAHAQEIHDTQMKQLFADDPTRGERYTAEAEGIFLDYSKNRITDETLKLLLELAEESGLKSKLEAMFTGQKINVTENRAVLHVALRAPKTESILVDGEERARSALAAEDKRRRRQHVESCGKESGGKVLLRR